MKGLIVTLIAIIRTIIVFSAIIISLRIMGKRQLGELEPTELVVAVLISNLASHPLEDMATPLIYGLVPVFTLLCFQIIISGISMKSLRLRTFLSGEASIIIENGKVIQSQMRKNRITIDELLEELRKKDITDITSVRLGIIETDGSLSAILYTSQAPICPKQMNLPVYDGGYPEVIISDGRIIKSGLVKMDKDMPWLKEQLKQHKVQAASEVFLMTLDDGGRVYFAMKEAKK